MPSPFLSPPPPLTARNAALYAGGAQFNPYQYAKLMYAQDLKVPSAFTYRNYRTVDGINAGQAFSRDGSSGSLYNFQPASGASKMGWRGWVKFLSLAPDNGICGKWSSSGSPTSDNVWGMQTAGAGGTKLRLFMGNSVLIDFVTNFVINRWYHIFWTLDGAGSGDAGKLKLYLDGTQIATPVASSIADNFVFANPSTTASKFWIGQTFGVNKSNIVVADFAAWNNYTPTQTDVTNDWNGGFGCTDANLPANLTSPAYYYRLDETSVGANAVDQVGGLTLNSLGTSVGPGVEKTVTSFTEQGPNKIQMLFGKPLSGPLSIQRMRYNEPIWKPDYFAAGSPAMLFGPYSRCLGLASQLGNFNCANLFENLHLINFRTSEDFNFVLGATNDGAKYWMSGLLGPFNTNPGDANPNLVGKYAHQMRVHNDPSAPNGEASNLSHIVSTFDVLSGNSYFTTAGLQVTREMSVTKDLAEEQVDLTGFEMFLDGIKQRTSSQWGAGGIQKPSPAQVLSRDYVGLHCHWEDLAGNISTDTAYGDIFFFAGTTSLPAEERQKLRLGMLRRRQGIYS